jgi:hypothetical protein
MRPGDTFIEDEIPALQRSAFPKALSAAYSAVDDLIGETRFLQCPPAKLARGHLIAWAVDFAVSQLIESGQWQVEGYDWPWFNKPTGKYLRVFTKHATLSLSQLPDTSKQPRHAEFRANAMYDEQMPLLLLPGEKELSTADRQRLLLVHGYHKLDFIHFVMPNPEKKPAWLGASPNVLEEIHIVNSDLTPVEGPDRVAAPTLKIKEELKKQIHDHGI